MIVLVCPLSRIPRPKFHFSFGLLGVPTVTILLFLPMRLPNFYGFNGVGT